MSQNYPYQYDIHGNSYPLIPFSIYHSKEKREAMALIDSGATLSLFKVEIAERLGIDVQKGEMILMRGVSGWIQGYIHKLKIEINNQKFIMKVVFSYDDKASFNILGRNNFFEKFKITFDEAKKSVILE